MNRFVSRAALVSLVSAFVASAAACELVLGIDHHTTIDGTGDATAVGDAAGGDAPSLVCVLPSQGDAKIRFGDLVPSADRFELCVHRKDGASPLDDTAVIASSGPGCPAGIGYKEILAPIALPSGTYDVAVVAPGAGCASAPLATASAARFDTDTTTTLYLFGTSAKDVQLKPMRESRATVLNSKLRFVHAIPGAPPFDVGVADNPAPPSKIQSTAFKAVPFASVAPPGTVPLGPIDVNGYVEFSFAGGRLPIGVAPAGTTDATLAQEISINAKGGYSILAIGTPGDLRFPEEIYYCDERQTDGIFSYCGGPSVDVTVDVFNAYLFGIFAPIDKLREQPVVDAVSALPSDVVCITDLYEPGDKQAIATAAKAHGFPYAATFDDNLDTPIDDPRDQDGGVPAPPTTAPCTGALATRLDDAINCASAKCSPTPNDDTATLIDPPVDCLSNQCSTPLSALILGNPAAQRCWQCALMEFYGGTPFGVARTACKNDAKGFYAFGGASSTVLLSRYPLRNVTQWVLPSTDWRVAVIHADVALANGATLSTYCTELTSPATGATRPYTGPYGLGLTDVDAWRAEQLLQIQRLREYVAKTSGDARAKGIVIGDFYAGPAVPGVLDGLNDTSFAALSASFPIAAPPGYAPTCTLCADNPITTPPGQQPSGTNTWSSLVLLSNVPVTDVRAASVILKEPTIPYQSYKVPLSTLYGFRSVVRIRPP